MSKGPSKNEIKSATVDDIILAAEIPGADDAGGFEMRVGSYINNKGERVPVELLPGNLCKPLSKSRFLDAICRYGRAKANAGASDHYVFSANDCRDLAFSALACGRVVDEPAIFRFKSETKLAYSEMPFDPEIGVCPTWDTLLGRMTSQKQLRAFIGSLFVPESYRQQYLWIYGEGGNGKGCIGRWLGEVFGRSAVTLNSIERGDRWLNHSIAYARAVIVADFERYGFTASGQFKSLSGGDNIEVEEKFKDRYSVKPHFKFIFLSNQLPQLSSKAADRRRAVICEALESGLPVEADFEKRLWAESGPFIAKCLADYAELCPGHDAIPFSDSSIEAWTTAGEEQYQEFFDDCFIKQTDGSGYVTVNEMNYAIRCRWPNEASERHKFYMWLKSSGVKKVQDKVAGKAVRRYTGIVFTSHMSSLPYRPNGIIQGSDRRRPVPSDFEKSKHLSLIKNEAAQEMNSET